MQVEYKASMGSISGGSLATFLYFYLLPADRTIVMPTLETSFTMFRTHFEYSDQFVCFALHRYYK